MSGHLVGSQPLIARVLAPAGFSAARTLMVVLAVACLAIRAMIEIQATGSAHDRLFWTRGMLLIGALMLQSLIAHSEAGRVYQHQAEQGLVRLAPAAPIAGDINRVLARYFLERFAIRWLSWTALTVAMLGILGASVNEAIGAAAACSILLAHGGLPLRDYSRGAPDLVAMIMLWLVSPAAIGIGIAAIRGRLASGAWAWLAMISVVLAALFVWRRWRKMVKAAPAYPAGRRR
jgi:hypothetical protein